MEEVPGCQHEWQHPHWWFVRERSGATRWTKQDQIQAVHRRKRPNPAKPTSSSCTERRQLMMSSTPLHMTVLHHSPLLSHQDFAGDNNSWSRKPKAPCPSFPSFVSRLRLRKTMNSYRWGIPTDRIMKVLRYVDSMIYTIRHQTHRRHRLYWFRPLVR